MFSNISKILSHSEEYQDVCEESQLDTSEVLYSILIANKMSLKCFKFTVHFSFFLERLIRCFCA